MEYINCQQKVRPLHFAFAISLSDEKSIIKAVEYSTALWGGLGNIFIPIWKKFPNMQIKSRCLGLIKDFDPDFIVNLTSIPLPRCIKENYKERIISKNSFVAKDSKDNTFRFGEGLSILALMAHIWETETKSILGKSRAVIFKDIDNSKYHKFWAFLFGKYPCKFERDYSSFFKKTLKAKEIEASFDNLCKLMMDEVVPPISLTIYHLTRYGRSGGFSSHILYVGDPTKNLDLIEFWNIRASGKRIFFLPTNAYKLFGKQVKGFIKSGDYQINKSVQNKADIQKSPSITNDEFGFVCDWVKNDLGYSLSRRSWLPNWGRKLERIAEDISPCEYYDKEVKNNLIFDRDRFSPLVLDRPSFLSKSSFQRLNRPYNRERKCWVNEIQLNDNYKNDYFFNFPSDKALTDIVSRKFIFGYPDKVRLTKGVVVYYNDGFTDEVNIHPIKTDRVIAELFKYHGMDISLSVAGLFAKRIIDYMGEIDDCRVFKIRGIRKILIELSNNKPSFGKAYGDIKGVVNSREKNRFGKRFTKRYRKKS